MVTVYPDMMGIQHPRWEWEPAPVEGTLGEEALDLAAIADLYADPWQEDFIKKALSVNPEDVYRNKFTGRDEPKWRPFENCLIVPRQNGKGSILEIREIAGLFLFGDRVIIHTAHNFDTAREAFLRVSGLIQDCPKLSREVKRISNSHGSEGIELKSGQRLIFKTRTASGGRGFTSDCLILDEAMFLGAAQIGAMMPTLSARPNAQIFYMGSAGDQDLGDCSQQAALRERAELGGDPAMYFAEYSIDACTEYCPKGCTSHDPPNAVESYAKANPAMGRRITVEYIDKERRAMKLSTFLTERLSVGNYPTTDGGWRIIKKNAWEDRVDEESAIQGRFSLAVDTTPDSSMSCLAVCGHPPGDKKRQHVEIPGSDNESGDHILDHKPGTQWVVPRILEIWKRQKPFCVVIDPIGQAGAFVSVLKDKGVNVVTPNGREFAQGCGEFRAAVMPGKDEPATLVHMDQDSLNQAVKGAAKRKLTDMWAWDKRSSSDDISPLVATTLAMWGYRHAPKPKKAPEPFMHYV